MDQKRNFEAILGAISSGKLDADCLITEKVPLIEYGKIYDDLNKGSIASILVYETEKDSIERKIKITENNIRSSKGTIGIIGAGNFTKMTMLPALKGSGAGNKYISSANGVSGNALCKKYGFEFSTTDYHQILQDKEIDLVMITTRHDQHARLATEALNHKKHVFVEKPLALNKQQLEDIINAYIENASNGVTLSVGFNRRFSPFTQRAKKLLSNDNVPLNIIATMNAGFIPPEVWVHDLHTGEAGSSEKHVTLLT